MPARRRKPVQTLRVATWNINSLRLRIGLLADLVAALDPDVICLQETKVPDELFPGDGPVALGYPHVVYRGMKGYNGVAHPVAIAVETRRFCTRLVRQGRLPACLGRS